MIDLRPGERATSLLASAAFFLVLCSYFVLRPVREAMGVQRDFDDLYWLWIGTLIGMAAANGVYAFLASRIEPRLLATSTYRLFALSLACFVGVLALWPALLETHFGTVPWFGQPLTVGHVFYIWLSVFNLFAVSLFWAQAANRFTLDQAKRIYPLLGAGGTLGAFAGSMITTNLVEALGPVWLMAGSLLLWRAAILASAAAFRDRPHPAGVAASGDDLPHPRGPQPPPPHINPAAALRQVVSSAYLRAISGWLFALAIAASLMYFTQARIITDRGGDLRQNIMLFGRIDLFTQAATLLLQITATAGLFRAIGVGRMLTITPMVLVLGYGALAVAPVYAVLAIFQAVFRATRHAIAAPARESLFTVVSLEQKYVSKAALDTFVYRAGDVAGSLMFLALDRAGAGLFIVAGVVAPLALVWGALGLWLGRKQHRLAAGFETP